MLLERAQAALAKIAAIHVRYCTADERTPEEDAALNDFDDVCCNEVASWLADLAALKGRP